MDFGKTRTALEKLYTGRCTVYEKAKSVDPDTFLTEVEDKAVLENIPCRLSFSSSPAATDGNAAAISQTIKLFLDPEISIKPGSWITVTQNGVTTDYKQSGTPAVYSSHQEIILELAKEYA